ncbi:hypothetical protein [Anaerosolibacter carboniphilus]|nr:hypothetical protein [Anaerosolibacter carboniphilus]
MFVEEKIEDIMERLGRAVEANNKEEILKIDTELDHFILELQASIKK